FRERAAKHREPDTAAVSGKSVQKLLPVALRHARVLSPDRNVRRLVVKLSGHELQVFEAADEAKVVARCLSIDLRDQFTQLGKRTEPVGEARGYSCCDADFQLVAMKGR